MSRFQKLTIILYILDATMQKNYAVYDEKTKTEKCKCNHKKKFDYQTWNGIWMEFDESYITIVNWYDIWYAFVVSLNEFHILIYYIAINM